MSSFTEQLEYGLAGESIIAKWLMSRGWALLPAYEKEQGDFKGPRILSATGDLISPDMLAFRFGDEGGQVHWIEAKSKAAFTWYRIRGTYQDGIDRRHWRHYLHVCKLAPWPVWLLFLHAPGHVAKDNPPDKTPPVGLFGNRVDRLAALIDHESDNHGPSGMVYWNINSLRVIASWEELLAAEEVASSNTFEERRL